MKKLWSFNYVYLILLNTLSSIGFYMTMPTLPSFAVSIGATLALAGVLSGIFSITALFIRPIAGMMTDRSNKKRLLMISTLVISLSTLGYANTQSVPLLLVLRAIHGASFAFSSTSNMALTAMYIPRERMGEGVGYMGVAQILATAVGPNLGLMAAQSLGYRNMFLLSSGLIFTAGLLVMLVRYNMQEYQDRQPGQKKTGFSLDNIIAKELLLCALMSALFSMSNGITSSFLAMMAQERGIANVGYFFTVSSVVVLLIRPFSGKLLDKKGLDFVLVPAFVLGAVGALMIGSAHTLYVILAAAVLKAVSQSSGQPGIQATCVMRVSKDRSGVALGTCYLGNDVGQGLGTMIGGAISGALGYTAMFAFCAVMLLSGVGILFLDKRVWKRHQEKASVAA